MSCGSTELCKQPGEQLVLRVERFLALGGTADVHQVRLLQQNSGAASQPAAAAPTQPAASAAHQHDEELQPGQQFAIKVARRLESYPAEQAGDACPALYLRGMGASVHQEWRVVQDLSSCRNIIKAFRLGCPGGPTPLPPYETWRVMLHVLEALEHMHAKRYVHQDVKPHNVLKVKNSAHRLSDHLDLVPHMPGGTPECWPPEMEEGTPHHMAYDVYCAGLLLLECRTAQLPFAHLAHLPWEQQRPCRTYNEAVASGCCAGMLAAELQLLKECLEVNTLRRKLARQLISGPFFRSMPARQ
ncbi:kinase-like domain-containing protein [Scenedesmus sp. NREL 46B-D3]|nr:kinase-like domain-containing protein [Scenedesmus sp. NREL 46B-D3]